MSLFSKMKHNESSISKQTHPQSEEIKPLSMDSLNTLKNICKSDFFNPSQNIGALEIDDEQNMWRSLSFNEKVAFSFDEIVSIEYGDESVYQTLGNSTGNYSGHNIGALSKHLSAGVSDGSFTQHSSAITKSSHIYLVFVYTSTKYTNVIIEAFSPAEAKAIKTELEKRLEILHGQNQIPQKENASELHTNTQPSHMSPFDEIRKYKELLDEGIITEEEFNIKKNNLLEI